MNRSLVRHLLIASLAAITAAGSTLGCSRSKTKDGSAESKSFTIWDPYPQFDAASAWVQLLTRCGSDAGVTIKRTAFDTTDLTNKALLAAQQSSSPDVL